MAHNVEQAGVSIMVSNTSNHLTSDTKHMIKSHIEEKHANNNDDYNSYHKPKGTTEDSGYLFEAKMLSLILLRALNNKNIQTFSLASNLACKAGLDDIGFRYKTIDPPKTNIIFLQEKYRETQSVTVEDLINPKKDLYLQKYFHSYLNLRKIYITTHTNAMYEDSMKNVNYVFIIYTSAKENFKNEKTRAIAEQLLRQISPENYPVHHCIIKTSETGKVFQLTEENEQIDDLLSSIAESRTNNLAESLSHYILNGKFGDWNQRLIFQQFHIFLAQNVIEIVKNEITFCECKFKPTFINSHEPSLQHLKETICKKLKKIWQNDDENSLGLQSLDFKLPVNFGKRSFNVDKNKTTEELNIDMACEMFFKLFKCEHLHNTHSELIYFKIDDDSVGLNDNIQKNDLDILGEFVGNLLKYDDETNMLKFDLSLSEGYLTILNRLKKKYDEKVLKTFRFDIQCYEFPKLKLNSLSCVAYDKKIVNDFVSNLYIYTNQSKEIEVEIITKKLIATLLTRQSIHSSVISDKCDAIYYNFYGKVHRWWKNAGKTFYLTKDCEYYKIAEHNVLHGILMNIHLDYSCKIRNYSLVKFTPEAITSFSSHLTDNKVHRIISDNIYFTSIKVYQYFNEILGNNNFIFFEVGNLGNSLDKIKLELNVINITTLIMIFPEYCKENTIKDIKIIIDHFRGEKVILINHVNVEKYFNAMYPNNIPHKDNSNTFSCLSHAVRKKIHYERNFEFQGQVYPIHVILNEASLELLSSKLLHKIIDNTESLKINQILSDEEYEKIIAIDNYIPQLLHRCLVLDRSRNKFTDEMFIVDGNTKQSLVSQHGKDKIVITESKTIFTDTCESNPNINIHWFIKDENGRALWNKTHGNLQNIIKYVYKITSNVMNYVRSLRDLQDRIVIISADPGMGKSTLLSHILRNKTNLWVHKIKLYDHIKQFKKWKKKNEEMEKNNMHFKLTLRDSISFLYNTINRRYSGTDYASNGYINVENENEVFFNDDDSYLCDTDFSEIKLFTYFYNNNRVALLFDGFDEVCTSYAHEVIQILQILKNSKVAHLWVTSRPCNGLEKLEYTLGTFSFDLKPLSPQQQISYLEKMWSKYNYPLCNNELQLESYSFNPNDMTIVRNLMPANSFKHIADDFRNVKMKKFTYVFLSAISTQLGNVEFTGNPQNLSMIVDIYDKFIKECFSNGLEYNKELIIKNLDNIANLTTLLEKFMEKKFYDIQYDQKKAKSIPQLTKEPDDDEMERYMKDIYNIFLQNHKALAAYLLLDENLVICERNIIRNFIEKLKNNTEKTGIINCLVEEEEEPRFIHFTYAEYFAVEFIFDKLQSGSSQMWQYFTDHILTNKQHGMWRFINSKLQNDQDKLLTLNKTQISATFDVMIGDNDLNKNAISVAIDNNFQYVALFLLQCLKPVINKGNIIRFVTFINKKYGKYCILCNAIVNEELSVLQYIIDLIVKIDDSKLSDLLNCEDKNKFNPLLLAMCNKKMSTIILTSLQDKPDLIYNLFILNHPQGLVPTIAHFVAKYGFTFKYYWHYLLMLNKEQQIKIFSVSDQNGRLPLHYAAKDTNINFLEAVNHLLGEEEFHKLCNTSDNDGNTPNSILASVRKSRDDFYSDCTAEENRLLSLLPQSESIMESIYSDARSAVFDCNNNYGQRLLKTITDE